MCRGDIMFGYVRYLVIIGAVGAVFGCYREDSSTEGARTEVVGVGYLEGVPIEKDYRYIGFEANDEHVIYDKTHFRELIVYDLESGNHEIIKLREGERPG